MKYQTLSQFPNTLKWGAYSLKKVCPYIHPAISPWDTKHIQTFCPEKPTIGNGGASPLEKLCFQGHPALSL